MTGGVSQLVAVVPIAGVRKPGGAGSCGHSVPFPHLTSVAPPPPHGGASYPSAAVLLCTHIIRLSVYGYMCIVYFSDRTVP